MPLKRFFTKENMLESVSIITAFKVVEQFIRVGRGVLFARLLGPKEYGIYTLAFFFTPLIVTLAKLGIPSCFGRYIPRYEKKKSLRDFLKRTYSIGVAGSLVIAFVCFLNSEFFSNFIYGNANYAGLIAVCSLIIIPYVIFENAEATFNGLRFFKVSTALKFAHFLIFTVLGVSFALYKQAAVSIILASLLSLLAAAAIAVFILFRHAVDLKSQSDAINEKGFYKRIFNFSVWYVLNPVVYILFVYTDKWMITRLLDLAHTGVYSVASNISGVIFTFGLAAGNVLVPNMSNDWENGEKDKAMNRLNLSVKANALFLLAGACCIFLASDYVIPFLYGGEYTKSVTVVGALCAFWLFNSIVWTVGGYAEIIEKTYIRFVCSLTGLVINLGLNYLLIPVYGLLGAAAATAISSAFTLGVILAWFRKEGLNLKPNTLMVFILPLIFFTNNPVVIGVLVAVLWLIFKTGFIFDKEEKDRLKTTIRKISIKNIFAKA